MKKINPKLPWGYWLRVEREPDNPATLVDETSRHWNSVREAW